MIPKRPDAVPRRLGGGRVADEIVDVAIRQFAAHGYHGTTIAMVAAEAGLSDAGVLYHFPSKADLFWAVVDMFEDLQRDRVVALLEPGGLAAVRNLAEWGAIMEERPDLLALQVVLGSAAVTGQSELRSYYEQRYAGLRSGIARLMTEGIAAGDVRSDVDTDFEATAFLAVVDGVRLQYFYSDGAVSIDRVMRTYVERLVQRINMDQPPT